MALWLLNLIRGRPVDWWLLILYGILVFPSVVSLTVSLFSAWRTKKSSYMASIMAFIPTFSATLLIYPISDPEEADLMTLGMALFVINSIVMVGTLFVLRAQDSTKAPIRSNPVRFVIPLAAAVLAWYVRGIG